MYQKPSPQPAKRSPLRVLRIVLAGLFFAGLTWLFVDSTGLAARYLGWMAKMQFLPAILSVVGCFSALSLVFVLLTVIVTLLFGRVYCSVVCPLGIMQDLFTRFGGQKWLKKIWRHLGHSRWHYQKGHTVLRYSILGVFVVLLFTLHPLASMIEPYSLFGRIVHSLSRSQEEGNILLISSLLFFVGISVWALIDGRGWCNNVCPVGSILGLLSKYSLFRPTIDADKCTGCRACERKCKAKCIDVSTHSVDTSRCVDCFDCLDKCQFGALSFRRNSSLKMERENVSADRRRFLTMTGALAVTGIASAQHKTDGGLAVIEQKQVPPRTLPVKPAGSVSLRHFQQHCTACQLCVTACPEHILRPSTDLQTLLQPELHFELGYCLTGCTRCADICPTGAIQPIEKEEKTAIQIGHAVWIAENCVVNTDNVSCGNCARHCPTGAVTMVGGLPAINTELCIGCGHCEYVCPSRPLSAIYVEGHQQQRRI